MKAKMKFQRIVGLTCIAVPTMIKFLNASVRNPEFLLLIAVVGIGLVVTDARIFG